MAPCTEVWMMDEIHEPDDWVNRPPRERRQYLMYFGGSIRPTEPQYSGGARQAFYSFVYLRNDSRVKLGGTTEDYV